ncbi:nuclear transport factor 2 family protein [Amycolatopsis palatopharyngis]|uniref:nuclear transport factor 2 family protein n=1 Tax=Amycolatopsis palatopharyngis TaxID=187982 RepID=UPI000E22140E|nr:nuclear transport factor 2 family protein [Amycolatopsis palatopharyngis]
MNTVEQRLRRLEDLDAIRQLDATYCRLLDDGDWDRLVELFTLDGEFIGLDRVRGREELRRFFGALAEGGLIAFWHYVTNLEIAIEGDTAEVRSALWQPCVQNGIPHVAAGRYHDRLVRLDGQWRYASKQVAFDYFAPLTDGWDHGRFTVKSAEQTYGALR